MLKSYFFGEDVLKKVVFSGIQPSGDLHIGNYYGAIKNWIELQKNEHYKNIYMIADLHSITVSQDPFKLKENCYKMFALLVSCGVNLDASNVFVQSHIKAHTQLAWILNCLTPLGHAERMTQFKQKSQNNDINLGLLTYPILQAADILIHNADFVPVGEDQKQHLELTRDLAIRFNNKYGATFKVPEPFIKKNGARIMSLTNPTEKMSKSSANPSSYILLTDSKDVIIKKIKRSTTDSDNAISTGEKKEGIVNLMTILSTITGENLKEIESKFSNVGYREFKETVGEAIANDLAPIQKKYEGILALGLAKEMMDSSLQELTKQTNQKIKEVYEKIGFIF